MYRLLAAFFVTLLAGIQGKVIRPTAIASEDYPRYAFHYAVKDPYSQDNKAQWEERDGDVVKGAYSLREPDGSVRVVEYSASDGQGFNAVVKNVGANIHPVNVEVAKSVAPVVSPLRVPIVSPLRAPIVSPVISPVVSPVISPVLSPLVDPLTYGLPAHVIGVPNVRPIPIPKTTLFGSSLPWDPLTGSYGGWVPLSKSPKAFIISKKVVNGKLQKLVVGPIPLSGRKITIIKKN